MIVQDFRTKAHIYAISQEDDGMGGSYPVRSLLMQEWVQFDRGSQNLQLQNGQVVVNGQNTVTMRWRPDCELITPECIVVIGGNDMLISSVVTDDLNQYTTILLA